MENEATESSEVIEDITQVEQAIMAENLSEPTFGLGMKALMFLWAIFVAMELSQGDYKTAVIFLLAIMVTMYDFKNRQKYFVLHSRAKRVVAHYRI